MKNALILKKAIGDAVLTMEHMKDNTFRLSITNGSFTTGKGAIYSDGTPINQPEIKGNSVLITKAEMKRLGTYKLYLNGKDIQAHVFGKWIDHLNRELLFKSENDFYYYFRRPDCGIVRIMDINGKHCMTAFHFHKIGEKIGGGIVELK